MFLIIGLGNPGEEYQRTRHNIGYEVVDGLRRSLAAPEFVAKKKLHSHVTEGRIALEKMILTRPLTYMNASGEAVLALKNYYKVPIANILVIHDDIDLPFGNLKISRGRGAAGHKGIVSIIESLASNEFIRIRIGIHPADAVRKIKAGNIVLKKFSRAECKDVERIQSQVNELISILVSQGLTTALNRIH